MSFHDILRDIRWSAAAREVMRLRRGLRTAWHIFDIIFAFGSSHWAHTDAFEDVHSAPGSASYGPNPFARSALSLVSLLRALAGHPRDYSDWVAIIIWARRDHAI